MTGSLGPGTGPGTGPGAGSGPGAGTGRGADRAEGGLPGVPGSVGRSSGGAPAGPSGPLPGGSSTSLGGGALPDTAALVAQVAAEADRAAEHAAALAEQLGADVHTLLAVLGGGPPAQLVQAEALAQAASGALTEAAASLRDAGNGLRAFAGRTT